MADDDRPDVEFVDAAAAEEVLAAPSRRGARTRLLVLAGAVAVVAGGVVAARDLNGTGTSPRPSPTPSPTYVAVPGGPQVVPGESVAGGVTCPAQARCSVWERAPASTRVALHQAFPQAVLVSATTVLANRTGHFEPELLRRVLLADEDGRSIRIYVRPVSAPDTCRRGAATSPSFSTTLEQGGYRISVVVTGPGATARQAPAHRLAADARLLDPL